MYVIRLPGGKSIDYCQLFNNVNIIVWLSPSPKLKLYGNKQNTKFSLMPMGVLAPGSAHARPSELTCFFTPDN